MNIFTSIEEKQIATALSEGGVFIEVSDNANRLVTFFKSDGSGSFKVLGTFDKTLSKKLYALRGDDSPAGFHMISLGYIFNKYIRKKYF